MAKGPSDVPLNLPDSKTVPARRVVDEWEGDQPISICKPTNRPNLRQHEDGSQSWDIEDDGYVSSYY
jgi:hypothetical protein